MIQCSLLLGYHYWGYYRESCQVNSYEIRYPDLQMSHCNGQQVTCNIYETVYLSAIAYQYEANTTDLKVNIS